MKFSTIVDIFIELLAKRRVTAAYLSEKYGLSPRTVYRYVEVLSDSVPLQVKRGRSGGITLADQFKLPMNYFTAEEYQTLSEALRAQYAQTADERFLAALEKLDGQEKSESTLLTLAVGGEEVFICERGLGLLRPMAEKLRVLESCMQSLTMAEIEYDKILQKVEPHALVFEGDKWGMYAFTYEKRGFAFFRLGRISSVVKLEEGYRKRPFDPSDIPSPTPQKTVNVRLEISKDGLDAVTAWLGAEQIKARNGRYIADVILPEDGLPEKLLSFGNHVKVLSPVSLKNKLAKLINRIAKLYP